ncbi:MAG: ABC transporter ATP-binding protein [Alphaproteobacteria bacterium]|nr:ABC transporter ATP-binding protein [Alphaproteobacteria bacterium]
MLLAEDLHRAFQDPDRGTVDAVVGIGFEVRAGEIYALLGPNGAGKTTTLRMLATLLRPDRGRVLVDGIDAKRDPLGARAKLAYVPAEAGLEPQLRALEAVELFARIQGVKQPRQRAQALLEELGAGALAGATCGTLSTGQKRRVVLARALVHDPPVLLLDEPTDGLDVPGRRDVLGLVRRLAAEGRAVLLSSHIMGEVEAVATRAGVVARGQLVAEGTLDELREIAGERDLSEVFVKLTGDGSAPA